MRPVQLQCMSVTASSSRLAARVALLCHPATPSRSVQRIEVSVHWHEDQRLGLCYVATGDVDGVVLPAAQAAQFAEHLWEHTCFEAFVAAGNGEYWEFNFSPSTQWAVYRFSAYRTGMQPVAGAAPPRIALRQASGEVALDAVLDLAQFKALHREPVLRWALSAVIEEPGGAPSYWALAHPRAASLPDFHHRDGFALELPAAAPGAPA